MLFNGRRHGPWCGARTYPTQCPDCGAEVFYFSCDCGCKVFFDELGGHWPKHNCAQGRVRRLRATQSVPRPSEMAPGWSLSYIPAPAPRLAAHPGNVELPLMPLPAFEESDLSLIQLFGALSRVVKRLFDSDSVDVSDLANAAKDEDEVEAWFAERIEPTPEDIGNELSDVGTIAEVDYVIDLLTEMWLPPESGYGRQLSRILGKKTYGIIYAKCIDPYASFEGRYEFLLESGAIRRIGAERGLGVRFTLTPWSVPERPLKWVCTSIEPTE